MFSILAKRWNVLFATKYLTTELAHSKLHMVYLAELLVVMADGLDTVRMRARRSRRWRRRRDRQRNCCQCDGRLWGVSGSAARTSLALVPCSHQRFCEWCIRHLESIGSRCPICRADITMVLHLFWHLRFLHSVVCITLYNVIFASVSIAIFAFSCLYNIVVAYNDIFDSVSIDIFAFSCVHKQCLWRLHYIVVAYNIIFDSVSIVYCTSILIRFAFHTGYFSGFGTWGVSTNLLSVSRSIDGGPAFSTRENLVPRIPVPRFPPPYMVPRFPSPRFQRPHTDTSALNDDAFLAFLARSSRVLMCLGAILLKHKKSSLDSPCMSSRDLWARTLSRQYALFTLTPTFLVFFGFIFLYFVFCILQTFMDCVMRRRSTVGGALEMFSLPLPLPFTVCISYWCN